MKTCYTDKTRARDKKALVCRAVVVCFSAIWAAITATPMVSENLGEVIAQSTEHEHQPHRELGAGWEQFGRALVVYSVVLLVIAILLVVAHRVHGNIFASEEEQRTRDEWYGGGDDDRSGW
jgi:hypothetical protein